LKTSQTANSAIPPIALTMGDPAGIGLDITLATWLQRTARKVPPFVFLGDPALLQERAKQLALDVPCCVVDTPNTAIERFAVCLPILPLSLAEQITPGTPSIAGALAAKAAIEMAVSLVMRGEASAVVTNPIAKNIMVAAGFAFPGHTEFLGALARSHGSDQASTPVMMLCGPDLRVVPVTIHIPLAAVSGTLTQELITTTIRTTAAGLKRWFGIVRPRLAVTGLNPHAGEAGLMGDEEVHIISPALSTLYAEGFDVSGPHPADTLFHERARASYDAAIAMYHDQALIPIKTLAFDEGVNVTLGLPFVRTSPDHGTAFAIAGTGQAHPDSLIAALKMAASMAKCGTMDHTE
jgi:4-hydroxythreonine-4-phosphate dehydrogenase